MSGKEIDAVVAGHLCLDIAPTFGEVSGTSVAEIFRPGKLLHVAGAQFSTGGPVSNTGLALKRLGVDVSLMGKCGDDPFGEILLELLRQEAPGAEKGTRVLEGENTSYTIALIPPRVDRIFLHCPGCNDTFGPEDIDLAMVGRARLFHFGYPPLMKRMYSSGGEELRTIFESASEAGAITSLDMALPDPDSEAGRAPWRGILRKTLPFVDLFLPSVEEIMFMLRRDRFEELTRTGESILDGLRAEDIRGLGEECTQMGARIVVIKCGRAGAYLHSAEDLGRLGDLVPEAQAWRARRIFEPTCRVERIASAIGSGDSAIAGFLAAFLRDEPPRGRRRRQVLARDRRTARCRPGKEPRPRPSEGSHLSGCRTETSGLARRSVS